MGTTTFKYDENGNLTAWRDGKYVGRIYGMEDIPPEEAELIRRRVLEESADPQDPAAETEL